MTVNRGMSFVIIATVYIIATIIHLIAAILFDPTGILFQGAADAQHFNGDFLASQWHAILTVWVPVLAIAGVTMWGIVNEYRRQTQTAISNARRRR